MKKLIMIAMVIVSVLVYSLCSYASGNIEEFEKRLEGK